MNLWYIVIILLIFMLLVYLKNYIHFFKILGLIGIFSGIFLIIIGYLIKLIIKKNLFMVNVSRIINMIFFKFLKRGMGLIVLGEIFIFCYLIFKKKILLDKK